MFKKVPCGETLPQNNVHAVSVSIPTFKDVLSYEEGTNKKIKSGYPRFVLHPYLKQMSDFLHIKYNVSQNKEVVLVSSKKFANLIMQKYGIKNSIDFKEDFGVVLVEKNTDELKSILEFIQHVGCNLSSRFAEYYLYNNSLIDSLHVEELGSEIDIKKVLPNAQLCTSGMNAIYTVLKALQEIKNGVVVQLGWLYLDTMNLIDEYESKIFYDLFDLDEVEKFLAQKTVSSIVTEVPTNPLLQCVDIKRLKSLCLKYNVALVIDTTFATAFTPIKEADVLVESLTKFASGNADVLMGCFSLSEKYKKYEDIFNHYRDKPYIKDVQRLGHEIKNYYKRVEKSNENRAKLVEYLKQKQFIKEVYSSPLSPVLSVTFNMDFEKAYDTLNFCKGPSLGTEFTLLMPYVYLAHHDLLTSKDGRELLKQNGIPIDLLRISVGIENIEEIKKEFDRLDLG
jgi:cystathionine gamma-synthase